MSHINTQETPQLTIVTELSQTLLSFDFTWDEKIKACVRHIAQSVDVSRVYIYRSYVNPVNEYHVSPVYNYSLDEEDDLGWYDSNEPDFNCSKNGFGYFMEKLKDGEIVLLNKAELPLPAQAILDNQNIISAIWVPIFSMGRWWGLIGFDECRGCRDWHKSEIEALNIGANAIGAGVERSKYENRDKVIQQIMGTIDQIYLVHDIKQDCFSYVSEGFMANWCLEPESVIENPIELYDFIHKDDKESVLQGFELRKEGKQAESKEEFRLKMPNHNGEYRWFRALYKPLEVVAHIGSYSYSLEDITIFKNEELRKLKIIQQQKKQVVLEINHRIKNHLHGICGLLASKKITKPEMADDMQTAILQIQSIALIHGLQSKTGDKLEPIQLVQETIKNIAASRFELEISEDFVLNQINHTIAEPEMVPMALIINELLSNAVKHSNDDDYINIAISSGDKEVKLKINTPGAVLPPGFDFNDNIGLGEGLKLVRSLLPTLGAVLTIEQKNHNNHSSVVTELILTEPVIEDATTK